MKTSLATYWRGLAGGSRNSLIDRLLRTLLTPLALPYALVQHLRASLYKTGLLQTKRLPRPVISVGNITVGGTGKTPVTAYVARQLLSQGVKAAVLSRGYGGTLEGKTAIVSDGEQVLLTAEECGDEPFLLASTVPGLMVVIGTDRHAAGLLAHERLAPDVFLLDDGFQHLRLHRDLNILLLDHNRPFGNGWTLPAGLLREPKSAGARADLVIQTRCPEGICTTPPIAGIPHCCCSHRLVDAIALSNREVLTIESLKGRKTVAFAGIAEPHSFFDGLLARGLDLVATLCLPDHVVYDAARINEIAHTMHTTGADCAVTTEKDGVKLTHLPEGLADKTLLARLDIDIDDPALLLTTLRNLLQK